MPNHRALVSFVALVLALLSASAPAAAAPATLVVPPVTVTVSFADSAGGAQVGRTVRAFSGTSERAVARTNVSGLATLRLPAGSYRFRGDVGAAHFFSADSDTCVVDTAACSDGKTITAQRVVVTFRDQASVPIVRRPLVAFAGSSPKAQGTTDALGQVTLLLPVGSYRFRGAIGANHFLSDTEDSCVVETTPCTAGNVVVAPRVTVTFRDSAGGVLARKPVRAVDGTATKAQGTTDAAGQLSLLLPPGSYRFRGDASGAQYFSAGTDTCLVETGPCTEGNLIIAPRVSVTFADSGGTLLASRTVRAFDGALPKAQAVTSTLGVASLLLPAGSYRFRGDVATNQFFSAGTDTCVVVAETTGCADGEAASIVAPRVTVTFRDAADVPVVQRPVRAFAGTKQKAQASTNAAGQVTFLLPSGSYRFRGDIARQQVFSASTDTCAVEEADCEDGETAVIAVPGT
jgi:hypothetical protein